MNFKLIVTGVVIELLTACGSPAVREFDAKATQIEFGMTAQQVTKLMGPPGNRQISGRQEALQWCETSFTSSSADSYVVAHLYDGKVVSTSTYRNRIRGTCESFFRPVQWINEPEKVIELRTRRLN